MATCSFCFERQKISSVTPGTLVRCAKCGELFPVLDPRFTGRKGTLRRALGLAGVAAGAAAVIMSVLSLGSGMGLESPEFRLVSAASSPPAVNLPEISNPRLGYELKAPAGWVPAASPGEDAFQFTLVNQALGAELSLAVETVEPASDFENLKRICSSSGADMRMLIARISGRPIEIESYEMKGPSLIEFEFSPAAGGARGPHVSRRGFLATRGGTWFWFYLSTPVPSMQAAYAQVAGVVGSLADAKER